MENWDEYVVKIADLLEKKENYYLVLMEISFEISEKYGNFALFDFAKAIEDNSGIKISPTTLRNYAWTYDKTRNLDLPREVPFGLRQKIAGREDRGPIAKLFSQGWSVAAVANFIKGKKKDKFVPCPNCGIDVKVN